MFLYKMEVAFEGAGSAVLIVMSDSDEGAFRYAESHLDRHYLAAPPVKEMVIVEKKRPEKGSGYVIETSDLAD